MSVEHPPVLDLAQVQSAAQRLAGVTYLTPLADSGYVDDLTGAEILFKLENLQRTGSFKLRGAYNRLAILTPAERQRGVVTASAGNHAQGVSLACRLLHIDALVVMPTHASLTKIEATRSYGARVELTGATYDDAERQARVIASESGRIFIPAFNAAEVIAGQGTIALEMLEQRPDLEVLVVPVGGGGLIAGIALAAKALASTSIRVVGVQAQGSDAALRSWRSGEPVESTTVNTMADGIAVKAPGELPLALMRRYVDDMVTVSDREISRSILVFLERAKLVVEGAGAVGLAAILAGRVGLEPAQKVGVVVSGGNLDVSLLSRILQKGLVEEGRQLHLATVVTDAPGQLSRLLAEVAASGANVLRVEHERWNPSLALAEVAVRLVLETRDTDHQFEVLKSLTSHGYPVEEIGSFRTKNFDN